MKTKKGFKLIEISGENILVAEGEENIDFGKIISMNQSASLLWKKIEGKEFNETELTNILMDEYDVDLSTAQKDIHELIVQWRKAGIVE